MRYFGMGDFMLFMRQSADKVLNMNRQQILTSVLLIMAIVIIALTLLLSQTDVPIAATVGSASETRAESSVIMPARPHLTEMIILRRATRSETVDKFDAQSDTGAPSPTIEAGLESKTPNAQAVVAWASLIDQVIAEEIVPAYEQAPKLKKAFDKLDKKDQLVGIRLALHLLSDEQFPAMSAIIYDAMEAPAVLDAIFSDVLNRSDGIKYPLMKELRKNHDHPLSSESARLLEMVKPQDEKMP